jgi:3-phenylpropionate/trans-cinnamate dioxygenase ferredoxin reductase subunit
MTNYDYLIVGGGMTAAAAADGIREVDAAGSIGLFSIESDAPYNRPPLSKGLWKGKSPDGIWRKTQNVDLHLGRAITKIVPAEKRILDTSGAAYTYGKLLLATGGKPRRLPFEDDRVIYFRTLADYRRLRALADTGRRFAVIGGGFIASEIAASLASNGKEVVMIFPRTAIGERMFPDDLARFVSNYFQQKGVTLLAGERVVASDPSGRDHVLTTAGGRKLVVDGVVAGIGIEPNVDLAESAGIETDNGIVVDSFLRSDHSEIYAAGDVASFRILGTHMRFEHEDNANSMGRAAGRNMAGMAEPYEHLPSFYSDMFDLGYEAVGELDSRFETFADWQRPNEKGVVYYLYNGWVRGVLLWNVWGQVQAARNLIAQRGPFTAQNLKGRLAVKPE